MKKKTINVLIVMALFSGILLTGCLKDNDDPTPLPVISGTYDGVFKILKKRASGTGFDTVLKSGFLLRIKADSGFTAISDTSKHANSNGTFENNFNLIQFADKTYKDTSSKYHLHGLYDYYYDGTRLQFLAGRGDTLGYFYDLRKTGN